jgi:hypothetical protein
VSSRGRQASDGKDRIRHVFYMGKTNKHLHVGRMYTMVKVMRCRVRLGILRNKLQRSILAQKPKRVLEISLG